MTNNPWKIIHQLKVLQINPWKKQFIGSLFRRFFRSLFGWLFGWLFRACSLLTFRLGFSRRIDKQKPTNYSTKNNPRNTSHKEKPTNYSMENNPTNKNPQNKSRQMFLKTIPDQLILSGFASNKLLFKFMYNLN